METLTKTYEQKKTALEQKLELAKELGLVSQVEMLEGEIRQNEIDQRNPYPEVTKKEACIAMLPKEVVAHKTYLIPCRHIIRYQLATIKQWPIRCWKWGKHEHTKYLKELLTETVGFGQEQTNSYLGSSYKWVVKEKAKLPLSAMIRLKEAKEKNFFESFQIWRPETESEQEARLLDPWLVGVLNDRFYKIADWR